MNNEEKILEMLAQMNNRMGQMQDDISGLKAGQVQMQEDISGLKAGQVQMQDDISSLKTAQTQMQDDISSLKTAQTQMQDDISGLKAGQVRMQDDISGLKTAQTQMQEDISDLRTTVTRVAVTQENVVIPQIKLLAEGHMTLLNTLARKDRVEALEDDISLLKTAVKALSAEVAELKKAQ